MGVTKDYRQDDDDDDGDYGDDDNDGLISMSQTSNRRCDGCHKRLQAEKV